MHPLRKRPKDLFPQRVHYFYKTIFSQSAVAREDRTPKKRRFYLAAGRRLRKRLRCRKRGKCTVYFELIFKIKTGSSVRFADLNVVSPQKNGCGAKQRKTAESNKPAGFFRAARPAETAAAKKPPKLSSVKRAFSQSAILAKLWIFTKKGASSLRVPPEQGGNPERRADKPAVFKIGGF